MLTTEDGTGFVGGTIDVPGYYHGYLSLTSYAGNICHGVGGLPSPPRLAFKSVFFCCTDPSIPFRSDTSDRSEATWHDYRIEDAPTIIIPGIKER